MTWFTRSRQEVADRQLDLVQADTARSRRVSAVRGARRVGVARTTVQNTAGDSRAISATRRY